MGELWARSHCNCDRPGRLQGVRGEVELESGLAAHAIPIGYVGAVTAGRPAGSSLLNPPNSPQGAPTAMQGGAGGWGGSERTWRWITEVGRGREAARIETARGRERERENNEQLEKKTKCQ